MVIIVLKRMSIKDKIALYKRELIKGCTEIKGVPLNDLTIAYRKGYIHGYEGTYEYLLNEKTRLYGFGKNYIKTPESMFMVGQLDRLRSERNRKFWKSVKQDKAVSNRNNKSDNPYKSSFSDNRYARRFNNDDFFIES